MTQNYRPYFAGRQAVLLLLLALLGCVSSAGAAPSWLDDEAEPQVDVTFGLKSADAGHFTLTFDQQDAHNFYALDCAPGEVSLRAVQADETQKLGAAKIAWQPLSQVTLKRRPWLMQVIVDGAVALTAYDATWRDGKIGGEGEGGWSWTEPRVQPVADLIFGDDFTRVQGESGEWKDVSGEWKVTASSDNINEDNSARSSNPFSYRVETPHGQAMTGAGHWFWDNYDASVAVRPGSRGTVGLAAYVQEGAKSYLAFLWNDDEGPNARQLVRVEDGKTTVLARAPGAYLPRQWYRLGIRTSPGFVETFIDGTPVFSVRDEAFGQGGIALLARDIAGANFDDVRVRSYDYYRQDFSAPEVLREGAWQPVGGDWENNGGAVVSTAEKGDYVGATRVLLAGDPSWSGYQMSAAANVGAQGGGGLVAGYRDPRNYIVFRWAGADSKLPFKGRQQLLHFNDGLAEMLSDEPATILDKAGPDGFVRVTLRYQAGALTVYAGDEPIAQAATESLASGRAGFYAQGTAPVGFRDAVVFFPPEPEKPKVAETMEGDAYMVGWASPSGEWPPLKTKTGLEYWNTGEFFGDTTISYPWRPERYKNGTLELALRATPGAFESGYIVRFEGSGDKDTLKVSLLRDDKVLREASFKLAPDDEELLQDIALVESAPQRG